MITQKTAPGGGPGAAEQRRGGIGARSLTSPVIIADLRPNVKRQFDKALSRRLDCVLTLADFEKSRLWGWLLGLYRRRLEKSIPL